MIPLREQELIRQRFSQELKGPVKLDLFTQRPTPVFIPGREECRFCPETGQMLEELAHLSDLVELRVHELGSDRAAEERYGIERPPSTVVRGVVNRPVVFAGIPGGELFPVLLEAIVDASGPPPELAATIKRRLKRLKRAVRIRVYVALDAPYVAEQARLVQLLGVASQHIRVEIVELSEYPQLAQQLGITAVPTTVIDGKVTLTGLTDPEAFVDQVVKAAEHQTVAARSALLTGAAQSSTPLPTTPAPQERGITRPSGLIIPGR